MLFSTKRNLVAVLALGSLLSFSGPTHAVEPKEVGATLAGAAALYLLKHQESADKNKSHLRSVVDTTSHYTKKVVNFVKNNRWELAAAAVVSWLAYHNVEAHKSHAFYEAHRLLLGKHHATQPNP